MLHIKVTVSEMSLKGWKIFPEANFRDHIGRKKEKIF